MERRVLYNLLRMNWLNNPSHTLSNAILPWQVQDYRSLSNLDIFRELEEQGIFLDKVGFINSTEPFDTPEALADNLQTTNPIILENKDHIYLLIFEMWRRFVPEKLALSIFCDELDHQIALYDREEANEEEVQDLIANLAMILDENVDQGLHSKEAFALINASCAHDIESFLYDFIAEQIDIKNLIYASELLESFSPYITDQKWFRLLQMRLLSLEESDVQDAMQQAIKEILKDAAKSQEIDFNLELLPELSQLNENLAFQAVAKQTVDLIKTEEELQDFLAVGMEFFRSTEQRDKEKALVEILNKRKEDFLSSPLDQAQEQTKEWLKPLKKLFFLKAGV